MNIRMYSWDDADAPALTSDAPGAMANVLRKVLVDGYGSGDQAKPGMGWEMQWDSETNQRAAFRSSDPLSTQIWLYVDDRSGADTGFAGGNRWARAWGMETFSGWDAGEPQFTGRFPLEGQSSFGVTIAKNAEENSDVVPWIIVASERSFYLVVDHSRKDGFISKNYGGGGSGHFFGDIKSRVVGDQYCFAVCGGRTENYVSTSFGGLWRLGNVNNTAKDGLYIARNYGQETPSTPIRTSSSSGGRFEIGWSRINDYSAQAPCPITGRLLMTQAFVHELSGGGVIRGEWPGHRTTPQNIGVDPIAYHPRMMVEAGGKTWVWLRMLVDSYTDFGGFFLDMDGPWYDD